MTAKLALMIFFFVFSSRRRVVLPSYGNSRRMSPIFISVRDVSPIDEHHQAYITLYTKNIYIKRNIRWQSHLVHGDIGSAVSALISQDNRKIQVENFKNVRARSISTLGPLKALKACTKWSALEDR